jgi:hypothetical protein
MVIARLFAALRTRMALWGGLIVIFLAALRVATRQGRQAAEAEFVIRTARARIRALRTSREVTHEVENLPDDERDRHLDRWMRD